MCWFIIDDHWSLYRSADAPTVSFGNSPEHTEGFYSHHWSIWPCVYKRDFAPYELLKTKAVSKVADTCDEQFRAKVNNWLWMLEETEIRRLAILPHPLQAKHCLPRACHIFWQMSRDAVFQNSFVPALVGHINLQEDALLMIREQYWRTDSFWYRGSSTELRMIFFF